ncbi:U2 snRNP-associated SURP motif-containing protein [Thelohanellus kitauei]|uniref:U2 snRNP-associated SURP motif-containing protein n=1 Tax=Thelohanellus kitauei TaxID=669202 RepID=A0A0C2ML18_THEKT|nr:U2 snRNP-associated SURP motif-containing protein [Thelohanellus kitauei]
MPHRREISKNYGIPPSKKSDSFLARKQKAEERNRIDLDETANLYAEFLAEFGDENESTSKNRTHQDPIRGVSKSMKPDVNSPKKIDTLHNEIIEKHRNDHKRNMSPESAFKSSSKSLEPESSVPDESPTLYVSNLPVNITEADLAEIFVKYGPLGTIRIVLSHKDPAHIPSFAFVSFMCVFDACMAYNWLRSHPAPLGIFVSWGKHSSFPSCPNYLSLNYINDYCDKESADEKFVEKDVESKGLPRKDDSGKIFVRFPKEWSIMRTIHRFIEYIIREGPSFEAAIMEREATNPRFRFLFDFECDEHKYYRWKLFSILKGDSQYSWRVNEFQMFANGSIWVPPKLPPGHVEYNNSLNSKVSQKDSQDNQNTKKSHEKCLNPTQRKSFDHLLRHVTVRPKDVAEVMVWAMDHSEYAKDIVHVIKDSLSIESTPLNIKVQELHYLIARLYVVNDILYNSSIGKSGSSEFRRHIEKHLMQIMDNFQVIIKNCERKIVSEKIKNMVIPCLNAWQKWLIFSPDFLQQLQNKITGDENVPTQDNIDGVPLTSNEMTALECKITKRSKTIVIQESDEDIDGEPLTQSELEYFISKKRVN